MLKIFLWLRYLRKRKLVFLSIAAVALIVMLMIVTDSIFKGYLKGMEQVTVTDIVGDVFIRPYGKQSDKDHIFLERLESYPQIEAAAPFYYGKGLLYVQGGYVREVLVYGLDTEYEKDFADWYSKLLDQNDPCQGLEFSIKDSKKAETWLGINVVCEPDEETDEYDFDKAREYIGKNTVLMTMGYGSKRRTKKLSVRDVVFSKSLFGDNTVFIPLNTAMEIEYGPDSDIAKRPNLVKVKLNSKANLEPVFGFIRETWRNFSLNELGYDKKEVPGISISLSEDMGGGFLEDLQKQMQTVLLVFGVICSVSVILMFCIFYMIVMTKQKDIAIIKSCGASSFSAAWIFLGFGAVVGIIGSAIGVVLGVIITKNVNVLESWVRMIFGIKLWRTSAFGMAEIPHQINWASIHWWILAAMAGCILGVLIPSIIAARTKPVKILRYE